MSTQKQQSLRTLLIELNDGRRMKFTIPSTYKITFGRLHPGEKGFNDGEVLRVYAGSTANSSQVAVFRDVRSFRDTALECFIEEYSYKHETTGEIVHGRTKKDSLSYEEVDRKWVKDDGS